MSANKPKQQESGRRPGQEEDETNRQNPRKPAEQRYEQGNPGKKNKDQKSGDYEDHR